MAKASRSASTLQLMLPEQWPDPTHVLDPDFRWARWEGGRVERGVSPLREIPGAAEVIAVLPASRVLFARAQLPPGRAGQQEKVLPFLVEDALTTAPEEVHAVLVNRLDGDDVVVAAVDKLWLRGALAELEAHGHIPRRVIAESELARLVQNDPTAWTLVRAENGGFLVLASGEAIAMDGTDSTAGAIPMGLQLVLEERDAKGEGPARIDVVTAEPLEPPNAASWKTALRAEVRIAGAWRPEEIDARGATRANFLQGEFAPSWRGGDTLGRFKPAAIVAAIILVVHGGLSIADWARLTIEAGNLHDEMDASFRKTFPEAKNVVDAPLQMSRNLADLRRQAGEADPSDFMPLFAAVAPRLQSAGATARGLRYDKGTLSLDLALSNTESNKSLEAKLGAPGVRVQVERVNSTGTENTASIRVSTAR
jgi:general secretion pathway protein L